MHGRTSTTKKIHGRATAGMGYERREDLRLQQVFLSGQPPVGQQVDTDEHG
jgi:hypothetical protein